MVKTQLFNNGGVVKWAYFQKKWIVPLRPGVIAIKTRRFTI